MAASMRLLASASNPSRFSLPAWGGVPGGWRWMEPPALGAAAAGGPSRPQASSRRLAPPPQRQGRGGASSIGLRASPLILTEHTGAGRRAGPPAGLPLEPLTDDIGHEEAAGVEPGAVLVYASLPSLLHRLLGGVGGHKHDLRREVAVVAPGWSSTCMRARQLKAWRLAGAACAWLQASCRHQRALAPAPDLAPQGPRSAGPGSSGAAAGPAA